MAWNFAVSAETSAQVGSGIQVLDETVANFLNAALDEAKAMYADVPVQGQKYFKVKNTNKNNIKSQEMLGIGLAKVNSDAANLPVEKQIVGFDTTITSYVLRNAMAITRQALDDDRHGVLGDHARCLMQSAKKTLEYIFADAVNRGFGTTGLSLLCEDGMALFDTGRPNPRASAGTWTNEDATQTLTAARVAAVRTAFRQYTDGNGDLAPQQLEKVVVSPDLEDTIAEIVNTNLKVDTSLNNTNVVSGTKYEVWDWLTTGKVVYVGDGENGLEAHIRHNPSITSWNDGSNPDKMWSRVRLQIGTGCKRPGKFYGCNVV